MFLGTVGLACGDDVPGADASVVDTGVAQGCTDNAGCEATEICEANVCVPKPCTMHDECGDLYCIAGSCQAAPSCAAGAVCPTGLACSPTEEICVEPVACTADTECTAPGEVCVGALCVANVSCATSAECPSALRCNGGSCREPCQQASDCGNQALFTCENGTCLNNCLGDANCADGFICEPRSGAANVCEPAECTTNTNCNAANNEQCFGQPHGRCRAVEQCQGPGDCDPGFFCNGNMECEELAACRRDDECAGAGYCENGRCQPSESCTAMSCGTGLECVNEVCVPFVCRLNADCVSPEVCVAGACVAVPSAALVSEVRITSPGAVLSPGTSARMFAIAFDASGRPVSGVTIVWESADTDVATIASTGVVTGESTAGTSAITASVDNGGQIITSVPVDVVNVGALASARRVTVINARTGAPIESASVMVEPVSGPAALVETDASGVAAFGSGSALDRLSVFHDDYDWITIVGLTGTDLLIRLTPATRGDRAGGLKGGADLSAITTNKPFEFALSGASFAGPLSRFKADRLFGGGVFNINIQVTTVALPSGITTRGTFQGFPVNVKNTYHALSGPGLRYGWSFGGKVELADLGISLSGGTTGILPNLIGLFPQFSSGVTTPATVLSLPTIVDTADIDGDGDTQESVPDYDNFTTVEQKPDTAQRLRFRYAADAPMPVALDSVILVSGVMVPGAGFVPLGIDGMQNESGIVPSLSTAISAARTGAEGSAYVVLALGVNLAAGLPTYTSAQVHIEDRLPAQVDGTAGWLSLADGNWAEGTRTVTSSVPAGADAWRLRFEHAEGQWEVWAAGPVETLVLSTPAGTDRALNSAVTLEAIDLGGNGGLGPLFDAAQATDALYLDRQTKRFSQNVLRAR